MNRSAEFLQRAGDILIEELLLVSSNGVYIDIRSSFREINIFESIYSPVLNGDIFIADNVNLVKNLQMTGNEYIVIKLKTPSFDSSSTIHKTFRIFSISSRKIIDQITQGYVLSFISNEGFKDTLNPLFSSYEGKISEIVQDIYENEIAMSRNLIIKDGNLVDSESTSLLILDETRNSAKFVSPGWSPIGCINWLASKSLPAKGKACNYFFWETNKRFIFGPLEKIFETITNDATLMVGYYSYFPPNTRETYDVTEKLFHIENIRMPILLDNLRNSSSGYYSNRLINLDLFKKDYEYVDYFHSDNFKDYYHTAGSSEILAVPTFPQPLLTNPRNNFKINFSHKTLFTETKENINELMSQIYGNRLSNFLELRNFCMEITVPGRTNIESGDMIYINIPDPSPVDSSDISKSREDPYTSGRFLITKIHHKINNLPKHDMIIEVMKDSFTNVYTDVY